MQFTRQQPLLSDSKIAAKPKNASRFDMMVSFPTSQSWGRPTAARTRSQRRHIRRSVRPPTVECRDAAPTQQDVSAGKVAAIQKIVKTVTLLPNSPLFVGVIGA